jgi:hypothetical protein
VYVRGLRPPRGGRTLRMVQSFCQCTATARYASQREHDIVSDARKELKEVSLHVGRWP